MKVTLAKDLGFCFGVRNALSKVGSIDKEDVSVLGHLINNQQVIDELRKKGIKFIDDINEIEKGTVVISAHGVPDSLIEKAKRKKLEVVDTTCLLVKRLHEITKEHEEKGYKIIGTIIGVKGNCSKGHKVGDKIMLSTHDANGLCGFFYHDIYPAITMLQYGGAFPWMKGDVVRMECPDRGNVVEIELHREVEALISGDWSECHIV